jgi:hypothetical protein
MSWTVRIDESGTDGQSPILAMAALFAANSRWLQLESEWREMLRHHGLDAIHCSQLRHQLGYDDIRVAQVMTEVEAIILRHVPVSVVGVMRKDDYDHIYKPTQPVSSGKHSPLGVLYRACLSFSRRSSKSTPLSTSTRCSSSMNVVRRRVGYRQSTRPFSVSTFQTGLGL